MTRDSVLAILISADNYVSGEKISQKLGVSRAAVNAAVKQLRDSGYDVVSVTNKGYLLKNHPDILSRGEMLGILGDSRMEKVTVFSSVESTNTTLKNMARDGACEGTVVISDEQTGGKGRLGKKFLSPSGCGIYLSYLMRPTSGLDTISEITAWTAVAVCDAISDAYGFECNIKWVNDLLMNRMKIAGILTELSVEGESGHIESVVIGIGINVNEKDGDFPPELSEIASSIALQSGVACLPRARLAASLIKQLDTLVESWPSCRQVYLEKYRRCNITVGNRIAVHRTSESVPRTGTAVALADDFSLEVVFDDTKTHEFVKSGDVSVRGLYGYT